MRSQTEALISGVREYPACIALGEHCSHYLETASGQPGSRACLLGTRKPGTKVAAVDEVKSTSLARIAPLSIHFKYVSRVGIWLAFAVAQVRTETPRGHKMRIGLRLKRQSTMLDAVSYILCELIVVSLAMRSRKLRGAQCTVSIVCSSGAREYLPRPTNLCSHQIRGR